MKSHERDVVVSALKHAAPEAIDVRVQRNGAFVLEIVNDGVPESARPGQTGILELAARSRSCVAAAT